MIEGTLLVILALGEAQKCSKQNDSSFFFDAARTPQCETNGTSWANQKRPASPEPSKNDAGRDGEETAA
jgi:hypothetical protein